MTDDLAKTMWLVLRGQLQYGPFSPEQMRRYVAERRLFRTDSIRRICTDQWIKAGSISWLFPPDDADAEGTAAAASDHVLDAEPLTNDQQGPLSTKGLTTRPACTLSYGDFQILKKIGSGGMGAVYLALQRSQQRRVALKTLSAELTAKPSFVSRFFREAVLLSTLNHPNIVQCYGMGEEAGVPFLAMEFIDGLSAADALDRLGTFSVADALYIVLRCAEALAYSHSQNVIHRDITLGNILITRARQVKVADLGLAKAIAEDISDDTDSGVTMGTPLYMAPEQALNSKNADCRSDIYSLGVVLYRLITGIAPFGGTTSMEVQNAKEQGVFTAARRVNADVPVRLDLVIDKMLAKNPRQRYQTCADLIRDVECLGMHGARLSFDVEKLRTAPVVHSGGRIEVLLIYQEIDNIRVAQQLLSKTSITANLNVAKDGEEAVRFLRREGPFSAAPMPHAIILAASLHLPSTALLLKELNSQALLHELPLIVLTAAPEEVRQALAGWHLPQATQVVAGEDPDEIRDLLQILANTCVTRVDAGSSSRSK